ncbi:NDR1/HIN1-like protein 13 [Rutidosis leptorrhynchoides]|uniref:NDR1/HIN1-like protein 13 n=1 Tax=Rutidosis leptorrhynchoides TaxID=125765 RepID=UPI003A9A31C5
MPTPSFTHHHHHSTNHHHTSTSSHHHNHTRHHNNKNNSNNQPALNNTILPPSSHTTTTTTNNNNNRRNNQQQHYIPSSTSSSTSASIRGCCCCLLLLLSFLLLVTIIVVLVIVFAVKPKKPHFNLQQVSVQYINLATISTTTLPTSASISLAVRMLFIAENHNKVAIKYGVSTFNIMYRGIPLGRGTVPGFYQPAHSVREIESLVTVDRVNLMQTDAADLIKDASVNDRVELRILGDVNAKIRILGLTSPSVQASVDCAIAISPTKRALTSKQCGFDGLQV